MKRYYLIISLLLLLSGSLYLLSGCGAIAAIVSAVFGSQGGFVFVPFLGDEKLSAEQTGKQPGMIVLFTNNPPANYKALSGATATIDNVSVATKEDGSFTISGVNSGLKILTIEHPYWVSIQQEVPVADPNSSGSSFSNFRISPDILLSPVGTGGICQFAAYGDGEKGLVTPAATWTVSGDIGTISSTGIFTATKAGTGTVKAISGSSSAEVSVTVVEGTGTVTGTVTHNGQGVGNIKVYIENTNIYTVTDGSGHYDMNGVPSTTVTVIADNSGQTGSAQAVVTAGSQVTANIVITGAVTTPTQPHPTITPGAGNWSTPVKVSDGTAAGRNPSILVKPSGDSYLFWYEDTSPHKIHVSYRPNGGSWGTSSVVATGNYYPYGAMINSEGTIYLGLGERGTSDPNTGEPLTNDKLYVSYKTVNGSWTSPFLLRENVENYSENGDGKVDSEGNVYALVRTSYGSSVVPYPTPTPTPVAVNIDFVTGPLTGPLSSPVTIASGANFTYPKIAVDASKNLYGVWEEQGTWVFDPLTGTSTKISPDRMHFSYKPSGGSWSSSSIIPAGGVSNLRVLSLVSDSSGNSYLAWRESGTTDPNGQPVTPTRLHMSYRPAGGSWGNDSVIYSSGFDSSHLPLICDSSNNVYIIWQSYDLSSSTDKLYFSYKPYGGPWSSPVQIDEATSSGQMLAIGVDSSGKVYAFWEASKDGKRDIYFTIKQ